MAKVTSKRSAMKRLHPDWSDEQIEQEIEEIAGDSQSGMRRIGLGEGIEAVEGTAAGTEET